MVSQGGVTARREMQTSPRKKDRHPATNSRVPGTDPRNLPW